MCAARIDFWRGGGGVLEENKMSTISALNMGGNFTIFLFLSLCRIYTFLTGK